MIRTKTLGLGWEWWVRSAEDVHGRPHFTSGDAQLWWDGSLWKLGRDESSVVLAAASEALHPVTVWTDEWRRKDEHGRWGPSGVRFDHASLRTSPSLPMTMDDLGWDYFVRRRVIAPVWYVDPVTGSVHHSGSKMLEGKAGKRYCSRCRKSSSANNFVSQHLRGRGHEEESYPLILEELLQALC